ncbi:MAG: tryptophan-rich sensory protein [Planctomycetia bacterium]|nr:tryptophan-rich sensory protein [Planctomycetia bacterium]
MRLLVALASTALVLGYVFGSGLWVSSGDGWYRSLVRPSWQPPGAVFGLIWPYNFVVLGIAGWIVANRGTSADRIVWLGSLAVGVAGALAWARLFYASHALWPAAAALAVAAVLAWPLVVVAWQASPALGIAVVPYAVWVAVATSLSVGYAVLNR